MSLSLRKEEKKDGQMVKKDRQKAACRQRRITKGAGFASKGLRRERQPMKR